MSNQEQKKDIFTIRMNPDLYDKMQEYLKSVTRKGKSINKYINELVEKDLKKEKKHDKI